MENHYVIGGIIFLNWKTESSSISWDLGYIGIFVKSHAGWRRMAPQKSTSPWESFTLGSSSHGIYRWDSDMGMIHQEHPGRNVFSGPPLWRMFGRYLLLFGLVCSVKPQHGLLFASEIWGHSLLGHAGTNLLELVPSRCRFEIKLGCLNGRFNGGTYWYKNGWFIVENPLKKDDNWGYPYFRTPPNDYK